MTNYYVKIFIIAIIIAGAAGSAVFYFTAKNFRPDPKAVDYPVFFEIPSGSGFNEIADSLYSLKLIRSKTIFKIYALAVGAARKLQSGGYEIKSSVSIPEIVRILKNGPKEIEVVIFPGMTLKEVDDYFSKMKIIKPGSLTYYGGFDILKIKYRFLKEAKSLEGFLFPDTYRFYVGSGADFAVNKILNNFKTKTEPYFSSAKNAADWNKILTLASFLEKEASDYEDRKIIAGILEKRLKVGIPLQVDATVIYAKCSGRFLNCPALKSIDFKLDSDYNTYYYKGLTPTPIGNPDLEAIKAVVEKKNSSYWYYLSDQKTKKTIFAMNLDDHNKNRAKYLLNINRR